jgi:glutathione synthase/RimK-type ligase-like ATP-grasp enzyme
MPANTPSFADALARARSLAATGEDEAAKAAYVEVLRCDPRHFAALNELATLAYESGHRAAARTAYEQAVSHHPRNPIGRVNLGNLLLDDGDLAGARTQYEAALAAEADFAEAHKGLARVFSELGEPAQAEPHWRKAFAEGATVVQRYRGTGRGVAVLVLVSVKGGNIPTRHILDDRVFAVTALYAEFHDPARPLPPHMLVFNAIGDADLCPDALRNAQDIVARTAAPVINPPQKVRTTGRAANAERLASIANLVAPAIRSASRADISSDETLSFPLLLRTPGYHTGQHFVRVENRAGLGTALSKLPGDDLLAISCLDARGADGQWRKYRVMFVDGSLYPLHLAISQDWKVHYFTAGIATNAAHREEEKRFLEDMNGTLGANAVGTLHEVARHLGLDYGGIDFGLDAEGRVLLFEANATMVVVRPDADRMWDYRRAPVERVLAAVKRMLLSRSR